MRIGLVLDRFDPRRGGVEQWTFRFARWLIRAGHEVHVVAGGFSKAALAMGAIAHEVPAAKCRWDFALAAEQRLRALALDVVHDTGAGWYCHVFQPHGGSRTASFEQNLLLLPPLLRPWKRRLAGWLPRYREFERMLSRQYADDGRILLPLSQMVARDMQRYHGVPSERMCLVYNGIDVEQFSPEHRALHRPALRERLGLGAGDVLLLIVAHNFELKGVATLLRAVARLAEWGSPVRLVVAGGKRTARWQRRAQRCGAAAWTHFVGPVDDPVPYYAAADAYVQPTFYDPCSLVVLEALASGLPVVTSRFNGAGELITPGREGYLVDDPADADELVQAIRPLLEPARREAMQVAARELALRHSFERNCQEILSVYQQIAHTGRRAA